MRHEHRVQLRWSDPDSYGHVNHARALSLLPSDSGALLCSVSYGRTVASAGTGKILALNSGEVTVQWLSLPSVTTSVELVVGSQLPDFVTTVTFQRPS